MTARHLLPLAAALCLAGCGGAGRTGPVEHESSSIERDSSESLRTELRMGAGNLKVRGGASKWMQADFSYNVPDWRPNVRYTTAAGRGALTVEQPSGTHAGLRNTTNEWDLRLNDEIPTDLTARLGAGDARLDLGTLSLRSLEVQMGAGELHVDLRGKPKHDYDVRIRGGAGEATVYLPHDVGINAKATGGLGDVNARGLRRAEGGRWINNDFGSSKVQVRLDIQGGVGQINLIAE